MMLFKIEDYVGLFGVEDVAEEICLYLDDNHWIIDEYVRSLIDDLYQAVEIGYGTFYASEILDKFNMLDDWFNDYIWCNTYDCVTNTLEYMCEGDEEEFLGEFLVTCIEE